MGLKHLKITFKRMNKWLTAVTSIIIINVYFRNSINLLLERLDKLTLIVMKLEYILKIVDRFLYLIHFLMINEEKLHMLQ